MKNEDKKGAAFDLRGPTKRLALRVVKLCGSLPDSPEAIVMRRQLVRCGTSVGAQYREACRARSAAEFRSKMQSALQELDETSYWFELLVESGISRASQLRELMQEAEELTAIFVSSVKTSMKGEC